MNYGIILSGGVGSRLKGIDIPKQYHKVGSRTILSYCLERMERTACIDAYVIVAAGEWQPFILREVEQLQNECQCVQQLQKKIAAATTKFLGFALPGENRQLSILNGLHALQKRADERDVILVQDAVRPLTSESLIETCIRAAEQADGAMPVLPMTDTVYYSKNGTHIDALLERDRILAGQAPEAFVFGAYLRANEALSEEEMLAVCGSSQPAVKAGMQIALVEGDEHNFKITTAEDLQQFQRIMEDGKR